MDKVGAKTETTNSLIVQKVFDYVSRYFVIIAGSLSGTTGLFTAVGYIAERSHLAMLGLTFIPVDLNQYLYTGVNFFVFLPTLFISSIALNIFDEKNPWPLIIIVIILGIWLIWRLLRRFKITQPFHKNLQHLGKKIAERGQKFARNHLGGLLFILMIAQLVGLHQMFIATRITNLLLIDPNSVPHEDGMIVSSTTELKNWILSPQTPKTDANLITYMGKLFIIFVVLGLLLWLVISYLRKREAIKLNLWQNAWLGISILVFLTQLILLPANYGILRLPNEFPVVEATFEDGGGTNSAKLQQGGQEPMRFILLDQKDGTFYLYDFNYDRISFSLTEQSLEKLISEEQLADSVTNKSVLDTLKNVKDKKFKGKEEFLKNFKSTIGDSLTVQYQKVILKHATKVGRTWYMKDKNIRSLAYIGRNNIFRTINTGRIVEFTE